jgi:ribosomal protein L11 methylase PrmA
VQNHTVLVPLDGRIFTSPALSVIAAGKFERGLARRMPATLPKGATVLDIGTGCGFLATHLSRIRPDLTLVLQEDSPALRVALRRLCEKNERVAGDRFRLIDARLGDAPAETLRRLVAEHRPAAVILSDPAVLPEAFSSLLPALVPQPEQIFLSGRWIEKWQDRTGEVAAALLAHGWRGPEFGFDPVLTQGFTRQTPK